MPLEIFPFKLVLILFFKTEFGVPRSHILKCLHLKIPHASFISPIRVHYLSTEQYYASFVTYDYSLCNICKHNLNYILRDNSENKLRQ